MNTKTNMLSQNQVTLCEKKIGVKFKNKELLKTALIHPSFQSPKIPRSHSQKFQRFEFLGDSVLNFFAASELFKTFPEGDEGFLSQMRSILVSKKLLAKISRSLGLPKILLTGISGAFGQPLPQDKILADSLEVLIAAIYFDRGPKIAKRFLARCFTPYFNQKKLFRIDPNPKSALQEFVQKKFRVLPTYHSQKNQDGFIAWVSVKPLKRILKMKGEGVTKQEAEASAAAMLLTKLTKQKSKLKKR